MTEETPSDDTDDADAGTTDADTVEAAVTPPTGGKDPDGTGAPAGESGSTDESERPDGRPDRTTARDRETTVATLSYLLGPLSGVGAWLLERDSTYVRFHAIQSVLFAASLVLLFLGLSFVQFLLVFVPAIGELLSIAFSFVYVVVALLLLAVWLRLMYMAREAAYYRLPLVGYFALQWSRTDTSQ